MSSLRCDMKATCDQPVTHIDQDGYAYCTHHGEQRAMYQPCRKLRPHELARLERGQTLTTY